MRPLPDIQTETVWPEDELVARYRAFMAGPRVQAFLRQGGRVFLASEHRPANDLALLLEAGHRHFAEKYVQETEAKWPRLRACAPNAVVHGFGRLQTNKMRRACGHFDLLEGIGRPREIAFLRHLLAVGVSVPPVCVQINCGNEPQKNGFSFEEADSALDRMRAVGLNVAGAMAIPPKAEDPAPHFRALRRFVDRHGLSECVMGMSGDYAQAIDLGATCIRIGRAVFDGRSR